MRCARLDRSRRGPSSLLRLLKLLKLLKLLNQVRVSSFGCAVSALTPRRYARVLAR